MIFRVHYLLTDLVPHVYCRVFAAPAAEQTFALIGYLGMTKPEFVAFRQAFEATPPISRMNGRRAPKTGCKGNGPRAVCVSGG